MNIGMNTKAERKMSTRNSISYDRVGHGKNMPPLIKKIMARSAVVNWIIMKFCKQGKF